MENVKQILNLFTAVDQFGQWMMNPFTDGKNVFATDGLSIIKLQKCEIEPNEIKEHIFETVSGFFSHEKNIKIEIPITKLKKAISNVPRIDEYRNCTQENKCNECGGEGEVEWEYGSHTTNHDCPECNGEGIIPENNRVKTGHKILDDNCVIQILESVFDPKILEKLIKTAELMKQDSVYLVFQKELGENIFTFPGIEILIMPKKKSKNNIIINMNMNMNMKK